MNELTFLDRDFLRCLRNVSDRQKAAMMNMGVSWNARPPLWGTHPIIIEPAEGFFQFDPGRTDDSRARSAIIIPVGWKDEDATWWGPLEDLCAFYPDDPTRWWFLRGSSPLLGPDNARWADLTGAKLTLHSTPLAWLRAGGVGSCILDWRCAPRLQIGAASEVQCDSDALADRLRQRQRECARPWRISVRRSRERIAA